MGIKQLGLKFAGVFLALLIVTAAYGQWPVEADGLENIEIFDIQKGRVDIEVKSVQDFQDQASSFLNNITDLDRSVNPLPDEGYMVRVPMDPPVEVSNQWVTDLIDEVVILYATDQSPYLLLFDNDNRSYFFHFEGDATTFLADLQRRAADET